MASASAAAAPWQAMKSCGHSASSACQLPRPRSCPWFIAASNRAACWGARKAAERATRAATGLRLFGIADEPPRPGASGSLTSPTSACASSARSVPILPSEPHSTATSQPSETQLSRWVCQAPEGAFKPRLAATAATMAGPASPSRPSVPTAPPSWSCNAALPARRSRARARTSGASQATSLKPKLMTCAGCISVRASIGVSMCRCARACSETIRRPSSASMRASAWPVTMALALSMTSWLVLPRCTWAEAFGSMEPTRAVSSATSGIARLPARRAASISGPASNPPAQAVPIVAAAFAGITPASASALARAASKASIAAITAWSENTSSIAVVPRIRAKIVMAPVSPTGDVSRPAAGRRSSRPAPSRRRATTAGKRSRPPGSCGRIRRSRGNGA